MDKFLELISELFEETPHEQLKLSAKFKEFEEWDSLIALSLIAMFDSEYNIKLSGEQIRSITTFEELYNLTVK